MILGGAGEAGEALLDAERAARLEGLAPAGGVCIRDVVHQMVRGRLDFAFEDLGEQRVENIAQPVRTWQWTHDAHAAEPRLRETAPPLPGRPSIAGRPSCSRRSRIDGINAMGHAAP